MVAGNHRLQAEQAFRKLMGQVAAQWGHNPQILRKHDQVFLYHDLADLTEIIDDDGNMKFSIRAARVLPTSPRGSQVRIRGWDGTFSIKNMQGRMMFVDDDALVDLEDEQALIAALDRQKPDLSF